MSVRVASHSSWKTHHSFHAMGVKHRGSPYLMLRCDTLRLDKPVTATARQLGTAAGGLCGTFFPPCHFLLLRTAVPVSGVRHSCHVS
jgi:hypothetical protein